MIRRLLRVVAGAGCRALPPEWALAARTELEQIDATADLARWTAGLLWLTLPRRPATWGALLAPAAALAVLDLQADSALTSLALLLAAAAAAGAATRRPWPAGLVVGLAIAVAHLVAPPAGGPAGLSALALVVLVLPALAAAGVGARLRSR